MADPERINVGRVAIIPKGDFVFGMQYYKLDLVTDNGNTYLAIADSKDVALSDTTKWKKIVNGDAITKEFYGTLSYSEVGPDDLIYVTDAAPYPAKSLTAEVNYEQDLHGYEYPWPGGQNKNLCPPFSHSTSSNTLYTDLFELDITGNNTYILSKGGSFRTYVRYYDSGKTYIGRGAGSSGLTTALSGSTIIYNSTDHQGETLAAAGVVYFDVFGYELEDITEAFIASAHLQVELGAEATAYSPYENICPISGHTATTIKRSNKNLLPVVMNDTTINGVSVKWNGNGIVRLYSTSSPMGTVYYDLNGGEGFALERGNYVFSAIVDPTTASNTKAALRTSRNDSSTEIASSTASHPEVSFTLTQRTVLYPILFASANLESVDVSFAPMVRSVDSMDSSYVLHNGTNYTFAYPSEAGIVYGGTLTIHQDGSGTLTVTHGYTQLDGSKAYNVIDVGYGKRTTVRIVGEEDNTELICNMYRFSSVAPDVGSPPAIRSSGSSTYIYDNRFTDLDTAKRILNSDPVYCLYKLATTVEYALTAEQVRTVLGANSLQCDTGTFTIEYAVDADLALDEIKYDTFFAKGEDKDNLWVSCRTGVISVNGTKSDTQALFFIIEPEGARYASRMIMPTGDHGGTSKIPLKQGHKYALRGTFTRPTATLMYGLYLAYKNAETDETWQTIELHSSTSTAPTETPTITFDHMGKLFLGVSATTDTPVSDTVNFVLEDITEV